MLRRLCGEPRTVAYGWSVGAKAPTHVLKTSDVQDSKFSRSGRITAYSVENQSQDAEGKGFMFVTRRS